MQKDLYGALPGLQLGEKFALMVFPRCYAARPWPLLVRLSNNRWATRQLPFELPDHWGEWLGSLAAEKIKDARLYLGVGMTSRNPGVLDGENEFLKKELHRLRSGILISGNFICHDQILVLTGATHAERLSVRSHETFGTTTWNVGAPANPLDTDWLQKADAIASAIPELESYRGAYRRIWAANRAFWEGLELRYMDQRIHQFIRCIERFVRPGSTGIKRKLLDRVRLFAGEEHEELWSHSWEIRSAMEHLGDAVPEVEQFSKEPVVDLFRLAYATEEVARHCLERFFTTRSLWPYFKNDDVLAKFWNFTLEERRSLWGAPLDLEATLDAFDVERVRAEANLREPQQ